jgi:sporulation-control protein spo0M
MKYEKTQEVHIQHGKHAQRIHEITYTLKVKYINNHVKSNILLQYCGYILI